MKPVMEQSVQSPEGANAVKIMTIHKAKGLQFPIVICPFFDWDIKKNKSKKWITDSKELLPAFPLGISDRTRESTYGKDIKEEDRKYELDQLNLVYVALTRPETALFVCGSNNRYRSNAVIKNWMLPFLKQSDQPTEIENGYKIGSFEMAEKKKKESQDSHFEFCKQIMDKPTLSTKNGDQWDIHDMDKKREFGTQLHLLLSKIKNESDIESELNKLVTKGKIPEDDAGKVKESAETLFRDSHFAAYFEQKSFNEYVIIDDHGNKHIPDKIIMKQGEVLVVDFKTGEEDETKHSEQLHDYMSLLSELEFENIRGEIFYTESCSVKAVVFE